mgnify:CR=1 FL=1
MSQQLINRSTDLKRLVDEGYAVRVEDGHLVVEEIPYLDSGGNIRRGTFVCPLDATAEGTVPPSRHVMSFAGETPCDRKGRPLAALGPTSPNPDPEVETPGEDLNVRMEGIRRDYPEYYNNILRQMQRCFRWRGEDNLRARVYFVINRDGSVSEIDILESSRNIRFNIEAMGAAECVGSRGRLGPLPEALPFDQLPIVFYFEPRSGQGFDDDE